MLSAREGEELPRQLGATLRGALAACAMRRERSIRRRGASEQLEVPEDRGEEIVEVVRDAAGELPDRLHLLRLAQRLFGRHQLLRAFTHPRFQRLVERAQRGDRAGALDRVPGQVGDAVHQRDLVVAPGAHAGVIDIKAGMPAAAADDRRGDDRARTDLAEYRVRSEGVARGVGDTKRALGPNSAR